MWPMRSFSRRIRRGSVRLTLLTLTFAIVSTGTVLPAPGRPVVSVRSQQLVGAGQAAAPGWSRIIEPRTPTELVGVEWSGKRVGAVEVRVQVAGRWLPWGELHGNPDEGPDPGSAEYRNTTTAGPAWTGTGVERVQLRVAEGRLPNLKVHLIHSPKAPGSRVASAGADPGWPGIISRAQWGANESIRNTSPGCENEPKYAATLNNSFVHHTVNVNTYSGDEAFELIRGIYAFHVQSNKWCDIGYNFIVDRFGRTFEGRYGGVDRAVIGAHAGGFNTGSTGVAVLGDFVNASPSGAAMSGLRNVLAWKLARHGVDARSVTYATSGGSTRYPSGTVVTLPNIAGHRDVSDTACPGGNLYNLLTRLRLDVQAQVLSTPPHPLSGWTPAGGQPKVLALNAYGALQPAGGQPAVTHGGFWPGWQIARAVVADPAGPGGWVLDGWGGLHPFGGASRIGNEAYWNGWDIARGAVRIPIPNSGYTLDGWGGVHPFGTAPPVQVTGYWRGWDIARGIVSRPDGLGGYVLDGWGALHPYGNAPRVEVSGYWRGWDIARGVALRPDGVSGYVLDGWGALHPFGGAPPMATSRYTRGSDEMRGLVLNAEGTGGYIVDVHGFVWPVGNAPYVKRSGSWIFTDLSRGIALMP
jgi:hypothetical protein